MKKIFLLVICLAGVTPVLLAQKVIKGTVRDAKTNQTLPGANIQVEGTYRGTITNRDGSYALTIPDSLLPATLKVSFIGYSSQKRVIKSGSSRQQNIMLEPSISQLQETVVTGDAHPALSIMERVIKRKQQWRKKLKSYKAEAYTRQNLSTDTSLVRITESASDVYWDKQKGHREVLKWRKQTANVAAGQNFAGVSYLPNFYDDNIDLAGFDMVGVTNPDALSYYNFKLLGQHKRDSLAVYHIKVIPKRNLQPLFKGDIYVLDEKYALLKVDLKPNDVVRFPPPISDFNLSYEQQFSSYGGDFWLPVDARIHGTVKIGIIGLRFPRLNFRQLAKVSDYKVNIDLPDSLFKKKGQITFDSTAHKPDSLVLKSINRVPLSRRESHAYATLDSSETLSKAFRPHGFLTHFIHFSSDDDDNGGSESREKSGNTGKADSSSSVTQSGFNLPGHAIPHLRFNRVDELFGGLRYAFDLTDHLEVWGSGGYSTGNQKFSYGGGLQYRWRGGRLHREITLSYDDRTVPRYRSQIYKPIMSAVVNLLGSPNYYDYYREEGFTIAGKLRDARTDLSLEAAFKTTDQTSLQTTSGYDLLGRNHSPRINPAIDDGHLNALSFTLGYNLNDSYTYGVTGHKAASVDLEWSDDALGSDFNYVRYAAHFDWSFDTFFKRRIFPNTLNISADAGTFSGDLPLQKFGIVDGTLGLFSPFESLRARRFRPYEGEQFAALNIEHNFRTVPFELLGLNWLARKNIGVVAFGGVAKTWVSDQKRSQLLNRDGYHPATTDGTHLETGLSLTGLFGLFRLDFTQRLDEPAFVVGLSLTRFR